MHRGETEEYFSAGKHNTSLVVTATIEGEKQKQKKRLTFKEPEIETRQKYDFNPTITYKQSTKNTNLHQVSTKSLEDLTLENQALQIVKHIGKAFVTPSKSLESSDKSLTLPKTSYIKETNIGVQENDTTSTEKRSLKIQINQNTTSSNQKPSVPSTPPAMRCPVIEIVSGDEDKSTGKEEAEVANRSIDSVSSSSKNSEPDSDWPTGARHQIQLLNLLLEQQRQQTKTAMSQIQLLKDQLEAETSARHQAQEQNKELMDQNKDLVNQIQQLFQQIQDLEKQLGNQKNVNPATSNNLQQEVKSTGLTPPPLSQYALRRNSGSLWASSTLSPSLSVMGSRRNSATPQQDTLDANPKNLLSDGFNRRTSITDDLAAISRFSSVTDWRLRRRGSSSLSFDFSTKGKLNNGVDDANPSPSVEKTKITPLFTFDFKSDKKSNDDSDVKFESRKDDSLLIGESSKTESCSSLNTWSGRSFKCVEPEERLNLTYDKRDNKKDDTQCQSMLSRSIETLRLFNS